MERRRLRSDAGAVPAALLAGLLAGLLAAATGGCGDPAERTAAGDAAARDAAAQVIAEGCGETAAVGGGSFVDADHVLTVAHVVAGADSVHVVLADGSTLPATVVGLDRSKDLAVLHVDGDDAAAHGARPLRTGSMRSGGEGVFVAWRDGDAIVLPFEAEGRADIDADDIDRGDEGHRRGHRIEADVRDGDSGSVLVSGGAAVAVVFGRSVEHEGIAWATDLAEATELLRGAGDSAVDTGGCLPR